MCKQLNMSVPRPQAREPAAEVDSALSTRVHPTCLQQCRPHGGVLVVSGRNSECPALQPLISDLRGSNQHCRGPVGPPRRLSSLQARAPPLRGGVVLVARGLCPGRQAPVASILAMLLGVIKPSHTVAIASKFTRSSTGARDAASLAPEQTGVNLDSIARSPETLQSLKLCRRATSP